MWREISELYSYHSRSTGRFADHVVHVVFDKTMRDLKQFGFGDLRGKRVLDLGCGQRYPFALQCAAEGASVTALDVDYVKRDWLPLAFYRTAKCNGIKRAAKSLVRRVLWDDSFYKAMETASGKPVRACTSSIKIVTADPTIGSYPLPSGSFDLIASNAVLEHVQDVPGFASEVARLLDTGGYFYAIIHSYYSVSGGHNMEWAYPDEQPSKNVPPWDHLRENRFPAWVYLNRCLPDQFKDAFAPRLQLLSFEGVGIDHEPGQLEGERLLTPGIAAELKAYPRDLLLTRAWRLIARKASGAQAEGAAPRSCHERSFAPA
jgi:SAM-dependent methyltransferase